MDKKLLYLHKLSSKDEIFCQYYVITLNRIFAAYKAKLSKLKNYEKDFDKLGDHERRALSKCASELMKKNDVKERISEIARIEAEKNSQASLIEVLEYYTLCMRRSKEDLKNKIVDTNLMFAGLKAADQLLKRYDTGQEMEDKILFKRGV